MYHKTLHLIKEFIFLKMAAFWYFPKLIYRSKLLLIASVIITIYFFFFFIRCSIFSEPRPYYCGPYCWRYGRIDKTNYIKEIALSAMLLVLAVIEFFVALAASIYGCQFACCGKEGCCRSPTKGKLSHKLKKIYWEKNNLYYSWFNLCRYKV